MTMLKNVFNTIIIALLIFLTVFLSNLYYWATNSIFYQHEQIQNKVSEVAMISQNNINRINDNIIKYLTLKTKQLQLSITCNNSRIQVFNQNELTHMKDVKNLFIYGYIVLSISFVILFIVLFVNIKRRDRKSIKKITVFIPLILIIFTLLILTIVLVDFDYWFNLFHRVSFTNELWQLNPKNDVLIQIMPLDFFISIFIRIVLTTLISLVLFMVAGLIYCRLLRRRRI